MLREGEEKERCGYMTNKADLWTFPRLHLEEVYKKCDKFRILIFESFIKKWTSEDKTGPVWKMVPVGRGMM
jgi:hypothetical protein